MDANRLITDYETKAWQLVKEGEMSRKAKEETSDELTNIIRQQQAEIDRLNRAYEVINKELVQYTHNFDPSFVRVAIAELKRIKDGEHS